MRRYTVQELSREGLENIADAIMDLADAEGLDAHRNAVKIRLTGLELPTVISQQKGADAESAPDTKQFSGAAVNAATTDSRVYLDMSQGKKS